MAVLQLNNEVSEEIPVEMLQRQMVANLNK